MTQLYALVAIGTAASLLAALLLMLRTDTAGKRTLLALARWWVATDLRTSCLVLAMLSAIAGSAFALIPGDGRDGAPDARAPTATQNVPGVTQGSQDGDQALAALRDYVARTNTGQPPAETPSSASAEAELPDVNSMIANLQSRLEGEPDDVQGWKMLGWSYLNTGRPGDAARAYETALKLAPDDPQTIEALAAARSAETQSAPMIAIGQPDHAAAPAAAGVDPSGDEARSMIRGMVDQLDARLETAPRDESGWVQLMRSRMVLGETDAAKAALRRSLTTFADDAAAKARLVAAARALGIDGG